MRLAAYTGVSTALATGVVLKALHQRANFYSACVYLSQSNANLMILTNLCLLLVGYILFGLQRLLYGRLRPIETEQLYEKAWFAVTETCLAMTIFRGDLGGWFVVMFVCLLVGKVWGWIGEGRVEILEQQPPSNPRLFHARLVTSLLLSVIFNTFMLNYAINTVLRQARPDMMVMFGFEFAVLAILSVSIMARYGISVAEIYIVQRQKKAKFAERRAEIRAEREEAARETDGVPSEQNLNDLPSEDDIDEMELDVPGWEEKGRWVFYLDLVTDFLKLIVYLSFFAILFTFYGLPIHILRDVVLTMRSFAKRILDFIRYRNATRDMNQRYPDATAEEIAREDVCIICREEMRPWQPPDTGDAGTGAARPARSTRNVPERLRPKKLPCGHLLHFACLRSWLERQQNCPTCRRPVATVTRRGAYGRMDGAAGERADGAPQGAGGNDPAAANGEAAEGRPRLWVLNLGPIRIGFGAGRGEMLQELDQRVNDGQAQGPQAPANMNLPQAVQPQRFGFGFGVGRPPTPRAPTASPNNTEFNHQNVRNQLQNLEQQINQEITSLMNTADQLQVTRLLQAELARLRTAQSTNHATGQGSPPTLPANGAQAYQTAGPILSPTASTQPVTSQRSLIPNPQISPMVSGDTRLPEGVTLPAGWTLVPLQRAQPVQQQQSAEHAAAMTSSVMTPYPNQTTASSYFTNTHSPTPSVRPSSSSSSNNIQQRDGIGGSSSSAQSTPTASRRTSQQTALAAISKSRTEEDTTSPKLDHSSEDTSSSTGLQSSPENGDTKAPEEPPEASEGLGEDREADTVEQNSISKGKGRAATVEDADDE